MNKFFTSALLSVVAVPFLFAAPHAGAGKAQNTTAPATTSTSKPMTKSKKHVIKAKKSNVKTSTAAPAATPAK